MNPATILSLFIIPFLGNISTGFGNFTKSKEGKFILLLIGGYFLYSYFDREQKKKTFLSGNSVSGNLAIRLQGALHPYLNFKIPFLGYLSDGTDEAEVIKIAREAKQNGVVNEVFEAYKVLFDIDLSSELVDEGVSEIFYLNAGTTASGTGTTTKKNTFIIKGQETKVKGGYVVREFTNSGKALRNTIENEIFDVMDIYENYRVGGIKGTWIRARKYANVYKIGFTDYWITLGAFKPNA